MLAFQSIETLGVPPGLSPERRDIIPLVTFIDESIVF